MLNLEVVIDLPFLAREINDAHRQVAHHGRSMLLEAKRAGEALLAAKKEVPHGGFKDWVKANCAAPYDTLVQYMRVAKAAAAKNVDLHTFEGGIRAFLDMAATPRAEEPKPEPRKFTREDAERLLKIHALAERGATDGERTAASGKAASFAAEFGMTPEEAVAKAKEFLPEAEKTVHQQRAEEARKAEKQAREEVSELKAKLDRMLKRKAELREEFAARSHDELVDLLANAYLSLEEAGIS
ncbi:MAG: hypothetical protein K0S56_266 [Microvirga sp.]|jgi:hypothetical protein|nr:hypothetical protein [Microvirga sp.]